MAFLLRYLHGIRGVKPMTRKLTGNVIPLPDLFERHFELALEASEVEDFQTARKHLEQALVIKPDNIHAMDCLLLTYRALDLFEETLLLSEEMFSKGYGESSEILKAYGESLIQPEAMEEIAKIATFLKEEEAIEPSVYQEIQQMLATHKNQMVSSMGEVEEEKEIMNRVVQQNLESNPDYLSGLIQDLKKPNFERQVQVIEQLKQIDSPLVIGALKEFLLDKEAPPVLKTVALIALKGLGVQEDVEVYKWERTTTVLVHEMPNLEEGLGELERFVMEEVARKTYHKDPMFWTFAMKIWVEFYYSAYPFQPVIKDVGDWAAALHLATEFSLGQVSPIEEVAELYPCSSSTSIQECYENIHSFIYT